VRGGIVETSSATDDGSTILRVTGEGHRADNAPRPRRLDAGVRPSLPRGRPDRPSRTPRVRPRSYDGERTREAPEARWGSGNALAGP
jgi:hypothetical protein